MTRLGKVAVIGAGFYGSTTAGLALDMNQSKPIQKFETQIIGQTTSLDGKGYEAIKDSKIVVITAGLPRKPGMSRMDLIETNAKIVRQVSENIAKHAPNSVVIVVSNPLDEMTALAQIATGFPKNRVMGQAGMLDTARFSYFVSEKTGALISEVKTLTLGSHGETMVPVPSQSSVKGKSLSQVLSKSEIDQLVDRTRNGGAEVVALLKTGSAYYAPSAAAAEMAKAVATDSNQVMPVCAWVDGEYGITGVYLGVEAQLGAKGINKVVETKLTDEELVALKTAAEAVRTKQADVKNL